jgi:protein-S-isoprenylcysteine O-methyltransferase Ste14
VSARKVLALAWGVTSHLLFAAAIATMFWALWTGLEAGRGRLTGAWAWGANAVLALQFPLLHSFLLSRRGARALTGWVPLGLGRDLAPTTFATLGSLQLLLTFLCWSPTNLVLARPTGGALAILGSVDVLAWLLLVKAIADAGIDKQTGFNGWFAVLRSRPVDYGTFPTRGLFRVCRQPVYLAFAATLWTGPTWTADKLLLVGLWTSYCVLGPRLKEERYLSWYGSRFQDYRARVPYIIPRIPT